LSSFDVVVRLFVYVCVGDGGRARKAPLRAAAAKLPGVLLLLRLAAAIHAIVDVPGRASPFPTPAEAEADAEMRAWRDALAGLDLYPFFLQFGKHVMPPCTCIDKCQRLTVHARPLVRATAASVCHHSDPSDGVGEPRAPPGDLITARWPVWLLERPLQPVVPHRRPRRASVH
jgi:hypothetical protein